MRTGIFTRIARIDPNLKIDGWIVGWVDSWGRGETRCCGLVSTVWAAPCMQTSPSQAETAAVLAVAKHHQALIGAGDDGINRARMFAA